MVGVEHSSLHIENNKQPSLESHNNWASNPNFQQSTHKAMYGSEGNSQGSAAYLNSKALNSLLKSSGIPMKGKPFQLFYFYIKDVFMDKDGKIDEKNINKFAGQLKTMTGYLNAWEHLKAMVYQGAQGVDKEKEFTGSVGSFLNKLCAKLGVSFPTNGTLLSQYQVTQLVKKVSSMSTAQLVKNFPVLGPAAVNVLNSLSKFLPYFSIGPYSRPKNIYSLWQNASSGGVAMPQGGNMPNPAAFTSFFDALSEGSTILSGVAQSNSSKLSYAQNRYNRLNAFVHAMLSDWQNIRKGMIGKMAQARS